jgi:transposase
MSPSKKTPKKRRKKTAVPKSKTKPRRREIHLDELKEIIERAASAPLSTDDREALGAAVETLAFLTQELESKGTSIRRLRRLLFGPTTEKTSKVLPTSSSGDEPEGADAQDETASEGNDAGATETGSEEKPAPAKRKGHGRNGASEYTGAEKVTVAHALLQHGDRCPECPRGKVYRQAEPKVLVRVRGMAPLLATVYELERLRCNLCGEVFTAAAPEGVGKVKYDETAATMIGLLRYGCGFPFNRLERLQGSLGIPLPASTQWEVEEGAAAKLTPAFEELVRQGAQGELLHNDDTTMRILGLEKPREHEAPSGKGKKTKERTGVFTTGIVSVGEGHQIALFFTGRKHAGENLADVLARREAKLKAPIQMSDGLSRNTPGDFETIIANCLVHARRYFVDVVESFPDEVGFVLEKLRDVYEVEAEAKELEMTPQERLIFHQEKSGPLMADLEKWLEKQIDEKKVEPNSGLGQAIAYMRKHWDPLTLFLREPGAPLDNNIAERALKKAILHRKGSLFYKTPNGARVGDLFMTLIHTCELNGTNPFDYIVALQRHHKAVAEAPSEWMPWNYRETLARLAMPP